MKRISELTSYKGVLPYASELFGVYQPLLGWKSTRVEDRIRRGFLSDKYNILRYLSRYFNPDYDVSYAPKEHEDTELLHGQFGSASRISDFDINLGVLKQAIAAKKSFKSILLNAIVDDLPDLASYSHNIWANILSEENLLRLLTDVVKPALLTWYNDNAPEGGISSFEIYNIDVGGFVQIDESGLVTQEWPRRPVKPFDKRDTTTVQVDSLGRHNQQLRLKLLIESEYAGILNFLMENRFYEQLKVLFYDLSVDLEALPRELKFDDPFESIDPKNEIDRVGLSPIGIVHLYRQYFFELDTFLGTPVEHVWLTPGATVELIETQSRKKITEKYIENSIESEFVSEETSSIRDELSDSIREENQTDVKLGANVSAHQSFVFGHADQSASFDMNKTQQTAREIVHKRMREQSKKLSSTIRKNYKSTFKTIIEEFDLSSKRFVLANTTDKLINYELRRKMRQVAVQVQDIGTYLSWQTYVDNPGEQLGIAELMHISKSPDVDNIPHPETILPPKPIEMDFAITIPFKQTSEGRGSLDESYTRGREADTDFNEGDVETIETTFKQTVTCNQAGYWLQESVTFDYGGADIQIKTRNYEQNPPKTNSAVDTPTTATFDIYLEHVNFRGQSPITVIAKLRWLPGGNILQDIEAQNKQNLSEFTARVEREYRKEYTNAAKERIELASNIKPRKHEDLREEERIVVYRKLITDLSEDIPIADNRTRHAVSELINSIFDVDKMLYFVSPEWWKPKELTDQGYSQSLGSGQVPVLDEDGGQLLDENGVPVYEDISLSVLSDNNRISWGGIGEVYRSNYNITEKSTPAKLGSSLGWLLQLDGDNHRNAFLNAPWVKAVIPIRPGKEKAAINWLKQVEGMNGITENDLYTGEEADLIGKPMLDVLNILAEKVQAKHEESNISKDIPDPDNPTNTDNTVSATPVDKVYEHGYYPLQGGFRALVGEEFEVFDQWIEVLPTDQIVPVEVKYDPLTGRQVY